MRRKRRREVEEEKERGEEEEKERGEEEEKERRGERDRNKERENGDKEEGRKLTTARRFKGQVEAGWLPPTHLCIGLT